MSGIEYKTYRIKFEKTGLAKYISHLDLNRLFSRSLARAGIEVAHSEGFNPHPKIVFASAISLGVESYCEFVDLKIIEGRGILDTPEQIYEKIKEVFPQGIDIIDVYEPTNDFKNIVRTRYDIFIKPDGFVIDDIDKLFEGDVFVEKKPGVIINLKDYIDSLAVVSEEEYIKIDALVKTRQEMYLNPENIVKAIQIKYTVDDYFIQKIEAYDKNNMVFR